jgi:hypothetical protein
MNAALVAILLFATKATTVVPPNGHKTTHPKPTHLTIVDSTIDAGGGVKADIRAGTSVAAVGKGAGTAGKVKITTVGNVELDGTIDGLALGMTAAKDTDLVAADGKKTIGRAREGTLFLVVPGGKAKQGFTLVEGAAPFGLRAQVATDMLVPLPHELLIEGDWQYVVSQGTDLFAGADLADKLASLPKSTRIEVVDENGKGRAVHVRTNGGIVLDGWVDAGAVRQRDAKDETRATPSLVQKTHEAFVDTTIYADAAGKKRIGSLRGGALVELQDPKGTTERAKIITFGDVTVEAYVRRADLRPLDSSGVP